MSDKFEASINEFYENERISSTEFLDLSGESKISNKDLSNNLDFVIKYIVLLSRVSLKNFHKIIEKQEEIEKRVSECEKNIEKTRKILSKGLGEIENSLTQNKPLTKTEVQNLVKEISQQPKLVEEKALELTSKLDSKIDKVEDLVRHLIDWTS